MTGPTCLFAFWIARVWERFKDAHWRNAIQAGLVPLSIGLMAASAYVVTGAADKSSVAAAITAATARRPTISPGSIRFGCFVLVGRDRFHVRPDLL